MIRCCYIRRRGVRTHFSRQFLSLYSTYYLDGLRLSRRGFFITNSTDSQIRIFLLCFQFQRLRCIQIEESKNRTIFIPDRSSIHRFNDDGQRIIHAAEWKKSPENKLTQLKPRINKNNRINTGRRTRMVCTLLN